jgi:chromosome segregation ATPase
MATVTDTDLQQLRDLITTLHSDTQKQITDGNAAVQKQIAELATRLDLGLSDVKGELKEVKAEVKGIQTQVSDIKADQRAQDSRFFWLFAFLLTTAVGGSAKLAKLY